MSPNKWKEISRVFNAVLKVPLDERVEFLRDSCVGDEELQTEVEVLLKAYESENSFLDSAQHNQEQEWSSDLEKGDTIESFEIERLLGKGGMGEVFLASDSILDRKVAIKVLPKNADGGSNERFLREARAVAALDHPNICTIYEIGSTNEFRYIVMQYAAGPTLAELIKKRDIGYGRALKFARQIATALEAAHDQSIVHRDVKPANAIVSKDDQITVLDFGLAKRFTENQNPDTDSGYLSMLSHPGMILGTVSYMSPEQASGLELDARTDVWSLGVVMYEMILGTLPFKGDSLAETLVAIMHGEPSFPESIDPSITSLIETLLTKDRDQRAITAEEIHVKIDQVLNSIDPSSDSDFSILEASVLDTSEPETRRIPSVSKKNGDKRLPWFKIGIGICILGLFGFGTFIAKSWSDKNWALENVDRVKDLTQQEQYFAAFDLAKSIKNYLPANKTLTELAPTYTDSISVISEPSGANVYLKRFAPDETNPVKQELIGSTPLSKREIPRGDYILIVEKEGFSTFQRTVSGRIPKIGTSFIGSPPISVDVMLRDEKETPKGMTFVPGGGYVLNNWSRLSRKQVDLEDYFIDKYETSNREFKEFIEKGGYQTSKYWKYPFIRNGKEISVTEATSSFVDKTGLPGPRGWTNQNYPSGEGDHPVTEITWYEAAAYAAFRKKELPTIFQWEKAARDGILDPRYNSMPWGLIKQGDSTDERANFSSTGTKTVGAYEFGMSPYGAFDMAGNVSEWIINRSGDDYVTRGGAWNDLPYSFGGYGQYPGFYTSSKLGFRCVRNVSGKDTQGDEDLIPESIPSYTPPSESQFRQWAVHYEYDRSPEDPKVVEKRTFESWSRETIEFKGDNNETVRAYLYLPKFYQRPLQVVHYMPPGDVVRGIRSLPDSVDMFLGPIIKSGRAVFAVELKGFLPRPYPESFVSPEKTKIGFRKQNVNWITDLRLGIDYLETRHELNLKRLSLLGISNGSNLSLLLLPIETRYTTAVLVGAGINPQWRDWTPGANYANFAPHISAPVLMLNGRYDETHPYRTFSEPLYKLIRSPKQQAIYDGGHIPSVEFFSTTVNSWLLEQNGQPEK